MPVGEATGHSFEYVESRRSRSLGGFLDGLDQKSRGHQARRAKPRTAHHARRALRQRLVGGETDWLGESRPASCRARRRPLNVAASRHTAPAVADRAWCDWRLERRSALRLWIHGCSSCSTHGSRWRPPTAPQGAPVPLRADCPARCACTPEPEGSGPRVPRVYRQRPGAASPHLRRTARVSSKRWQARRCQRFRHGAMCDFEAYRLPGRSHAAVRSPIVTGELTNVQNEPRTIGARALLVPRQPRRQRSGERSR